METGISHHSQFAKTEKKLMNFSIGPVQEFIAQARKTRDLWFGSFVLSEISKEAAIRLAEVYNADLIFPYLDQKILKTSVEELKVANKVVALVSTNDPRSVALDVRKAVNRKWLEFAKEAKDQLGDVVIGPMWDRQVKDLIEFYAVWSRFDEEQDYQKIWMKTEQLMSARKTLRDFKQNEPADLLGDIKSSLDGGRESVLKISRYTDYQKYGIKKSEHLDAISLVKRMSRYILNDRKDFKSVCEIAFLQFLEEIEIEGSLNEKLKVHEKQIKSILRHYRLIPEEPYELKDLYNYYYPERMEEAITEIIPKQRFSEMLRNNENTVISNCIKDLTDVLENFYKGLGKRPTSYYALIVGDGDRMGDCLRSMITVEEHQKFSQKLSQFASNVERIVTNNYRGQMIYSGGDDLMALLPLNNCLNAVQRIQQAFSKQMKDTGLDSSICPTLSVGVAIVHMIEPLEDSLNMARLAEKLAKERRNELAIHFQRRGGSEEMRISVPFDANPVENIKKLQHLYRSGYISSSFAYNLRAMYLEYVSMEEKGNDFSVEQWIPVLELEIRRLLLKKRQEHIPHEKLSGEVLDELLSIFHCKGSTRLQKPLELLKLLAEQCIIAITLEKVGDMYEA
ncbi:type III-B CRISPR-associated protein Cas10/Cmr2 [Shouchella clausii]|uniref:Type III-B CRISPR-associated protein Cas10/Cmr2 n=1 Tax=Shouchella clausii TaxID=79880 RepID=A0A268P078_SHOCL|nr:type III-B CRISPR-associated protein Cas10/Cmr2 [Shouchella clausii]PAE89152.1 type III-B CRISPR-associated protein Cas10/Cmr2 [Shouchella clausii]